MTISHQSLSGLTSGEARARLAQYGSNEVNEAKPSALLTLLRKVWAPVPWMLEATIMMTLLSARSLDAAIIGFLLVIAMLVFALLVRISLLTALPFAQIVLVASVPVALPATFTLAQALGAQTLAKRGVLVTRLSALEEAASKEGGEEFMCSERRHVRRNFSLSHQHKHESSQTLQSGRMR